MKKFILKLHLHDDKEKRKALKIVSALPGIDSIAMDMKDKKLTVVGTVDPVSVVSKLRKFWPADIILVGPAKEPEKKGEQKKDDAKKEEEKKKEEGKKDDGKKEGDGKKEQGKKEEEKKKEPEPVVGLLPYGPYYPPVHMPYRPYYPPPGTYYHVPPRSVEENPNACTIC